MGDLESKNKKLLNGKKRLRSVEIVKWEYKTVNDRIKAYQTKRMSIPQRFLTEKENLYKEYQATQQAISDDLTHYVTCLRADLPVLTQVYQKHVQDGKRNAEAQ